MSGSLRLGILLVIVLLAWVIIYYRLVAPALVEPEPPPGLALQSGDTVSTEPETDDPASDPDELKSSSNLNSDSGNDSQNARDEPGPSNPDANGNEDPDAANRLDVEDNESASNSNEEANAANGDENAGDGNDDDEVVLPKPPPTTPYIVKSGDTMESIAESWFGSKSKWLLISWENPFADPRKLEAGITLRLPPKDARVESIPRELYEELTREIRYVISSGDTLSEIAKRFYGKSSLYNLIAEANKDVIKNPDVLQAGVEIVIPRYQQPAE